MRYKDLKLIWGQSSMLHRSYRKNDKRAKSEHLELYDLKKDPGESENIADKLKHIVEDLKKFAMSNYRELIPPKIGLQSMFIVSYILKTLKQKQENLFLQPKQTSDY